MVYEFRDDKRAVFIGQPVFSSLPELELYHEEKGMVSEALYGETIRNVKHERLVKPIIALTPSPWPGSSRFFGISPYS